jgi:hypothetical protein
MESTQMTTVKKRRNTRAESAAVAAHHDKRAAHKPVMVEGIGPGELITVTPGMFSMLDVDPAYQRGETSMVGQIVRALQGGGKVLDPVTLCQRRGSDKYWIVDGYQRVCAFQQLRLPFQAMLHKSSSVEDEKSFFVALNARRAVSPNVIVKAWTGPIGAIMRKANESFEHPLSGRINFTQSANATRFAASSLLRACLSVIGQDKSGGRVEVLLSRLDLAMSNSIQRARVEHFLRLIGRISPTGYMPVIVMRAIATVAFEHWEKVVEMPSPKVMERMRVKQWAASTVLVEKYLPILINDVRKIWK